ncbi:MAG: type II/IV secretion system protein, partial [Rhodothermales bacterium]|nr:type II/IV secretion system protein [Rhodothermales bacterium]
MTLFGSTKSKERTSRTDDPRRTDDNVFAIVETDERTAPAGNGVITVEPNGDGASQDPVDSTTHGRGTSTPTVAAARDRVVQSLLRSGTVSKAVVRDAELHWQRQGQTQTLWRFLAAQKTVSAEAVYAEAARIYAFRRIELDDEKVVDAEFSRRVVDALTKDQQERLLTLRLLPMKAEIDSNRGSIRYVFATRDPMRPETLRLIHEMQLDHYEICYAPEAEILPILESLFPKQNEFLRRIEEDGTDAFDLGTTIEQGESKLVDEEKLDAEINRSGLINLFEAALVEAVRQNVSDIHIFPNPQRNTEIHFRIDGQLQLWHLHDKVHPEAVLAVVKDRCGNVDRFDREIAQDGFIQRKIDGALIRFRVSVLPIATANREVKAESIVIRVLDDRKIFTDLSAIGLLPEARKRFKKAISQPHGMVIMTGPTGSGKSTTLVAALREVLNPTVNALTIEDPVEYIISGVRQIKLGNRLNMEQALRSILRHDPDIVMVGEMRDRITAELAIKLANTGHLTFSTLHTNDAPSAVARLYKMGIEPFLIAYAINLIVAQRLLRTLCPECKALESDPDVVLMRELGFSEREIEETTLYIPQYDDACPNCKGVGYKGRQAISEAMYFSRTLRNMIVDADEKIDEDALRTTAIKEG